jgi:hypothetical protein
MTYCIRSSAAAGGCHDYINPAMGGVTPSCDSKSTILSRLDTVQQYGTSEQINTHVKPLVNPAAVLHRESEGN